MQKTSIFGHLGQKGPFWTVFSQNGQNGENYQKSVGTFFSRLQALTVNFQKKAMNGFREKALRTNGRTYVQTHVRTRLLRSQTTIGRENKNLHFRNFRIFISLGRGDS